MGMTIEDAGNIISRYDINFYDDNGHKIDEVLLAQAFDTALDIMCKYQKIEQILKDIPYGGDSTVKRIREVIEDGNVD